LGLQNPNLISDFPNWKWQIQYGGPVFEQIVDIHKGCIFLSSIIFKSRSLTNPESRLEDVAVIDSVKFAIFNLENLILDSNSATPKTIRNLFLSKPKIILNFDPPFWSSKFWFQIRIQRPQKPQNTQGQLNRNSNNMFFPRCPY